MANTFDIHCSEFYNIFEELHISNILFEIVQVGDVVLEPLITLFFNE